MSFFCVSGRDVLLWTPTHGRAKAGRPARIYIQQLCKDTGCCPEDLHRAMNDGRSGERGSGISVLLARHDDDDDVIYIWVMNILCTFHIFMHGYVTDRREYFNPWPSVFQFGTFWSVALGDSKSNITVEPSSRHVNPFSMLFIYSSFLLCSFRSHLLLQNNFASFASDCWYVWAFSSCCW